MAQCLSLKSWLSRSNRHQLSRRFCASTSSLVTAAKAMSAPMLMGLRSFKPVRLVRTRRCSANYSKPAVAAVALHVPLPMGRKTSSTSRWEHPRRDRPHRLGLVPWRPRPLPPHPWQMRLHRVPWSWKVRAALFLVMVCKPKCNPENRLWLFQESVPGLELGRKGCSRNCSKKRDFRLAKYSRESVKLGWAPHKVESLWLVGQGFPNPGWYHRTYCISYERSSNHMHSFLRYRNPCRWPGGWWTSGCSHPTHEAEMLIGTTVGVVTGPFYWGALKNPSKVVFRGLTIRGFFWRELLRLFSLTVLDTRWSLAAHFSWTSLTLWCL